MKKIIHALVVSLLSLALRAAEPLVQRSEFGRAADGTVIEAFTLTNRAGATAKVITYGAIVADLRVPDREGKLASVIREITFSEQNYTRGFAQAAMVAGRVANRIANAKFTLDGHDYTLIANTPPHTLHGGRKGFGRALWKGEPVAAADGAAVKLTLLSPDGDEGFPGNLTTSVTYTLTDANTFRLDYAATTDKPTPINLTNHAYFNLAGAGDVAETMFYLNADRYTVADATLIPTGEIKPVAGTALDFTRPAALNAHIAELGQRKNYDHSFVINRGNATGLVLAARTSDAKSGRSMEVWTTEPGVQLYTSSLAGNLQPNQNGFFCLETQHYPDSIHHPEFPSTVLRPGANFRSTTEYRFSISR